MEPTFRRLETVWGLTVQRIEDGKVVKAVTYSRGKWPLLHHPLEPNPSGCPVLGEYNCNMGPVYDSSVPKKLQRLETDNEIYEALEELIR